ncbi:MAG: C1 family peptidase [Rikenellaceae bacterium]
MNKFTAFILFFALFSLCSYSQEVEKKQPGYQFTTVKEIPVTSVKNQSRTSTCWSFSTLAYLESELIRMGKGEQDLSEMFIVSNSYYDKADKYIRTNGNINFSPGSSFGDALTVIREHGIVPESVMPGLNYGEELHAHNELDAATAGYIKAIAKNPNGKYSTAWKNGFRGILNAYLGDMPQKFVINGKEYTPQSYAKELGINPDDYVSITSYTHHPFYTQFILEIPDNWRWDTSYNLPIDEMMKIFDYAIEQGYTVLWGSDVSEKGFTKKGIAFVPESDVKNMADSDQAKWLGLSKLEIDTKIYGMTEIVPEKKITQEDRQIAFDNGQTTDDHGMQIFGIANDQNGNKYYMVKNSWGITGDYKGIWYVSDTFVKYKTMNIVVNKNSVPKDIRVKLGIK